MGGWGELEVSRDVLPITGLTVVFIAVIGALILTLAGGADRLLGHWSWYGNKRDSDAIERALFRGEERRALGRGGGI